MGSQDKVHFGGLRKGSTVLRVDVEEEVDQEVQNRVHSAANPDSTSDAHKQYLTLNGMLQFDNAVGTFRREKGKALLNFPGITSPESQSIGPIKQASSVEGVLIRIGGKDRTIPAYIENSDGENYVLELRSRGLAKRMGQHLFDNIRVSGEGQANCCHRYSGKSFGNIF